MAAHRTASTAAPFTKGEVNRAGVLLLDLRELKFGAGDERLNSIFLEMAELIARFDRAELSPHDPREGLKRVPSLQ